MYYVSIIIYHAVNNNNTLSEFQAIVYVALCATTFRRKKWSFSVYEQEMAHTSTHNASSDFFLRDRDFVVFLIYYIRFEFGTKKKYMYRYVTVTRQQRQYSSDH